MYQSVYLNDGTGSGGYAAKVNADNELLVSTAAEALRANAAGNAYCALADVTSATTDDDFFYILNNDARDLVIFKIQGWCDDASQEISILIGATDGGTGAGDTITPANLNAGSSNLADVICVSDATDLAITGGTAIDLLKFHATVLLLGSWDYPSGIIIPNGRRLHMAAALAGLINLNVFFYFRRVS
ncbi:hypothetical protein LCGC14_0421390 [marine sediment metagenome]|uniref:Uncharacterized protein n=1 Tax=marine sediment metagenome TaxID=412755 RepID=A0A0F9T8V4_9ZZZZ